MGQVRPLQKWSALACFVIGFSLVGGPRASAQQENRLVVEARALFKAVDRGKSSRCRFDNSWDSRPVLAETAKRYLGLTLLADLVVSEPPAKPMQIIDPDGRETDAFCSSEDRNAVWRAAIAALQPGGDNVLTLTSVSYGFPVFNPGFTRAALMVQYFSETWRKTADGTPRRSIEASGGAQIYARRGRAWRQIDYDSYFTAH